MSWHVSQLEPTHYVDAVKLRFAVIFWSLSLAQDIVATGQWPTRAADALFLFLQEIHVVLMLTFRTNNAFRDTWTIRRKSPAVDDSPYSQCMAMVWHFFPQDRFRLTERHLAIIRSSFRSVILREHENIIFGHIESETRRNSKYKYTSCQDTTIIRNSTGQREGDSALRTYGHMIPFFHRNGRHRRHNMSLAD